MQGSQASTGSPLQQVRALRDADGSPLSMGGQLHRTQEYEVLHSVSRVRINTVPSSGDRVPQRAHILLCKI